MPLCKAVGRVAVGVLHMRSIVEPRGVMLRMSEQASTAKLMVLCKHKRCTVPERSYRDGLDHYTAGQSAMQGAEGLFSTVPLAQALYEGQVDAGRMSSYNL